MTKQKIIINESNLWILIDENRTWDTQTNQPIINGFYCFYNFNEPNVLFLGERFKDQYGDPIVFQTEMDAFQYVNELLGLSKE